MRIIAELGAGETVTLISDPAERVVYFGAAVRNNVLAGNMAEPWRLVPGANKLVFRAAYPIGAPTPPTWTIRFPIWWQTS